MQASRIRFLLGFVILALGVFFHFKTGIRAAWTMYLAGAIIMGTHFFFGTVTSAFNHLNKGNVDKAEDLILQIQRPDWLYKRHRGYYYFTLGMIDLQKKRTGYGEQHLQKALDIGLKSNTDNALVALNIAHVNFVNKNYKKADEYRQLAESFGSDDLLIKENLEKLKNVLKEGSN